MAKSTFSVLAIHPGRRADYAAFKRGETHNQQGEMLHTDLLAMTVETEANSKSAAEAKVRAEYPRHSIDPTATQRL